MRSKSEPRLYSMEQCISNNTLAALRMKGINPEDAEQKLGIGHTFGYFRTITGSILAAVAEMTGITVQELGDPEYAEDLIRTGQIDYSYLGR